MLSPKKIENYYLWGIKAIIFLIPLLPLYVSPSMLFPFITGKNFAFRILVELAAVLWAGLLVLNKEYRLRSSAITLSILTFTFIVGLADLLGVSPYNSFWSNYERMEGYITILHLALYFMIIKSVIRTKKDWNVFLSIFVAVSGLVSLYALAAPPLSKSASPLGWEYGTRISGTIGNPPFLASYLLLSIFLGVFLIFSTQRLYLKITYVLLIIINSIAIYFSASRGAILSAFIGAGIFGLAYILGKTDTAKVRLFKKAALSVIVGLVVLSVIFWSLRNADFVKDDRTLSRFANIFSDASVQTRLSTWKMALNGVEERPILGWGQENFIAVYTVNPIPFVDEQIWIDRAHNIILDWLTNAGILGLLSYLAILGAAYYTLRKAFQKEIIHRGQAAALVAAFTVYFVQNLFVFDTINTYLLFFTLLACIDNLEHENLLERNSYPEKIWLKSGAITILALSIFSFVFYNLNYKPIKVSRLIVQMRTISLEDRSFSDVLDAFNKALSLETFGSADLRDGMKTLAMHIINSGNFTGDALKFIEATVVELEKDIPANRYNFKFLTEVINLYKKIARHEPSFIDRTEALIRSCMLLNPEYQWLYMALADVCVLKKDYECAFVNVKKVTDWDPQNDKKQLKLALAAIYASKGDIVRNSLENIKKIRMSSNKNMAAGRQTLFSVAELYQFARVYLEVQNFREALQYYNKILAIFSDQNYKQIMRFYGPATKAKLHFEAAEIYLAINEKENAIKEARKAAELSPENFAQKAEELIYSLNN